MNITTVGKNNDIARIRSGRILISDTDSALDLIINAVYETRCRSFIIDKSCIAEEFFRLRTGLAGDMLQKFVNYGARLAIVGDFSGCTSKPLKDFIYESNMRRHIYFAGTEEDAVAKLGG